MGSLSIMHWLIVVVVAALLFGGRGKISSLMGDFAKGIKAFKSGMKDEEPTVTNDIQPQVTATPGAAPQSAPHAAAEPRPGERA